MRKHMIFIFVKLGNIALVVITMLCICRMFFTELDLFDISLNCIIILCTIVSLTCQIVAKKTGDASKKKTGDSSMSSDDDQQN